MVKSIKKKSQSPEYDKKGGNVKNPRNKFLGVFGVLEHAQELFFLSHELK